MKKKIEEDRKKRIEKLIKEKISHIPIKGDYDGTHALYLNDGAISGLADALCKEVVFRDEMGIDEDNLLEVIKLAFWEYEPNDDRPTWGELTKFISDHATDILKVREK